MGSEIIVEHPYPQRSPEWFAVRLGKISGSLLPDLMPSEKARKEWTDTQLGILQELASQILTGERVESYQNDAMLWGQEQETTAITHYEQTTGRTVRECGFFENSEFPGCGASPDGIMDIITESEGQFISEAMTLEVKCPLSKTHMKYLADPEELWKKYRWQVVMEVLISGASHGEIISFDPRFPESKRMVRFVPGNLAEDKEKLSLRLAACYEKIQGWLK